MTIDTYAARVKRGYNPLFDRNLFRFLLVGVSLPLQFIHACYIC